MHTLRSRAWTLIATGTLLVLATGGVVAGVTAA